MLDRGGHAAVVPAGDRLGDGGDRGRRVGRERAVGHDRPVDARDVGHRTERDVDAGRPQVAAPGLRVLAHGAERLLGRGGALGAAHGTVRIGPPSWSTHTSTPRPARRRLRVRPRSCTGSVTLSRNRIAPAARPSPRTRRTYRRLGPGEAQDHQPPDLLLEREPVDRLLGRRCSRACGEPPARPRGLLAAPGADRHPGDQRDTAARPRARRGGAAPAPASGWPGHADAPPWSRS